MNPAIVSTIMFMVVFAVLGLSRKRKRRHLTALIVKRKRKGANAMSSLIEGYLGKECIIYIMDEAEVTGTIRAIEDGWISVDNGKEMQAVNLDFVARVREHPRDKNGKKKTVVTD